MFDIRYSHFNCFFSLIRPAVLPPESSQAGSLDPGSLLDCTAGPDTGSQAGPHIFLIMRMLTLAKNRADGYICQR
ncbi:hypothetical protein D1AOALGA4SA_3015 [Olavius algarvensis Delta 1 endosymbiont]|nr:hypothetical protein D1AOALGA4SA_3015 [Olavius algarvensis Delta 1 endosymbiont]